MPVWLGMAEPVIGFILVAVLLILVIEELYLVGVVLTVLRDDGLLGGTAKVGQRSVEFKRGQLHLPLLAAPFGWIYSTSTPVSVVRSLSSRHLLLLEPSIL